MPHLQSPVVESAELDRLDRRIIEHLRRDARMSFRELGENVGLSANTVADRVRKLQARGVIEAFEARVNLAALALTVHAVIEVKLRPHMSAAEFEAAAQVIPGVLELTLLTGSFDYMVRVACRDQTHLMEIVEQLRTRAGADNTLSRLVLKSTTVPNELP